MHLKMSAKSWPFCPGGDDLTSMPLEMIISEYDNFLNLNSVQKEVWECNYFLLRTQTANIRSHVSTVDPMMDVCKTNIDPRLFASQEAESWNPEILYHLKVFIINWLALGKFEWNFKWIILVLDSWGISCEIASGEFCWTLLMISKYWFR